MSMVETSARLRLIGSNETDAAFAAVGRNVNKFKADTQQSTAAVTGSATATAYALGGLAVAVGATKMAWDGFVSKAAYDRRLSLLRINLGTNVEQTRALGEQIEEVARKIGVSRDKIASTAEALAPGLDYDEMRLLLPLVSELAEVSGAADQALASGVKGVVKNFGISRENVQKLIDMLATNTGRADLKEYAGDLEQLSAAFARSLGYKGTEGAARMLAILQAVREETGSTGQAVSSLNNIVVTMFSEATAKKMKELGVPDLRDQLEDAAENGEDLLAVFSDMVMRATGGDFQKMADIMGSPRQVAAMTAITRRWGQIDSTINKLNSSETTGALGRAVKLISEDEQAKINNLAEAMRQFKEAVASVAFNPLFVTTLNGLTLTLQLANTALDALTSKGHEKILQDQRKLIENREAAAKAEVEAKKLPGFQKQEPRSFLERVFPSAYKEFYGERAEVIDRSQFQMEREAIAKRVKKEEEQQKVILDETAKARERMRQGLEKRARELAPAPPEPPVARDAASRAAREQWQKQMSVPSLDLTGGEASDEIKGGAGQDQIDAFYNRVESGVRDVAGLIPLTWRKDLSDLGLLRHKALFLAKEGIAKKFPGSRVPMGALGGIYRGISEPLAKTPGGVEMTRLGTVNELALREMAGDTVVNAMRDAASAVAKSAIETAKFQNRYDGPLGNEVFARRQNANQDNILKELRAIREVLTNQTDLIAGGEGIDVLAGGLGRGMGGVELDSRNIGWGNIPSLRYGAEGRGTRLPPQGANLRGRSRMSRGGGRVGVGGGGGADGGGYTTGNAFLDLIARAEGTDKGRGYNETLGYGALTGGPRDLTNMTLDEIDQMQTEMLRHPENRWNSSAVGRYQFVQRTLRDLRRKLGLRGDEKFDAAMQDRLAKARAGWRGRDVSGLRNEWEGLRRVSPDEILRAYDARGGERRFNAAASLGITPGDVGNLATVRFPGGGTAQVHKSAAAAYQGWIDDLAAQGAPITGGAGYGYRNIAGSSRLSQHAYGTAMDVNTVGVQRVGRYNRNIMDPKLAEWIEANPEKWQAAQRKWGLIGGEHMSVPDPGHMEYVGAPPTAAPKINFDDSQERAERLRNTLEKPISLKTEMPRLSSGPSVRRRAARAEMDRQLAESRFQSYADIGVS